MPDVTILGRGVPVEFLLGEDPEFALDEAALLKGLAETAELISRTDWTPAQAEAFHGMKKIVFFEGKVQVNSWTLDRPGCDEDDAIFYWEASEFMRNPDPRVRANTFFHDCWHVVQFKRDCGFAMTEEVRVAREVEAIDRQIEVAERLGCRPEDVAFLRNFQGDQALILARLKEGVSNMHHGETAFG